MSTEQQVELFHDDINDAVGTTIQALGGAKKVGADMYPSLRLESAYARVRANLNPDKPDKWAPEEIQYLAERGRAVGCHAILEYLCAQCGYAPPVPVSAEDQRDELMRAFNDSVAQQRRLIERMENLARAPALRSAK